MNKSYAEAKLTYMEVNTEGLHLSFKAIIKGQNIQIRI